MRHFFIAVTLSLSASWAFAQAADKRPFEPSDVHRIARVSEARIAPSGDAIVYVVTTTDVERDRRTSDLYLVAWDGSDTLRLTHTPDQSESSPRFSPDGRWIGFLSARSAGDASEDKPKSQVWLLDRRGGEARVLTSLPGGVSAFEWSPDSRKLALVANDPDPAEVQKDEKKKHETPPPIVVDRYTFKRDRVGYLSERRNRIHLFDIASSETTNLTPGPYDSGSPAWSPDSTHIAFVSKRAGEDPDRHNNTDIFVVAASEGAQVRQLTQWEGADRAPQWSPNGETITYLRDGPEKYTFYDQDVLAIVPAKGGEESILTADLDRGVASPRWSPDGERIFFLLTDDRQRLLASVDALGKDLWRSEEQRAADAGVMRSFDVAPDGKVVAVRTLPHRPPQVVAWSDGTWQARSHHNDALIAEIDWATVKAIDFDSDDGTRVGAMLLLPPGYDAGKAYPTIAYIHGGPVGQDGYDFDEMSQALAAAGYVVVNPNYRGSSGRGNDFSRQIFADWGNLEVQDIHAAVDYLTESGISDPKRLGIGGWSYGGMSTNYSIATDTRFSAAVSGSSISNMITGYGTDQYTVQYENELGLPWENLDAYFRVSFPFFESERIETPTLFLCGEKDFNVPLLNSEQMYQALRSRNVPTRLVIYPGQFHGLSKPSYIQDRIERMIDWYDTHLGGGNP